MKKCSGILVAAVFAAAVPAVAQDVIIVEKSTVNGKVQNTETSYLGRDHARKSQGDGEETITDFKTGQYVTLNSKKKTYYVTTRKDRELIAAEGLRQLNSLKKKSRDGMKQLSSADQKQADESMKDFLGEIDARKTGTTRKIAGYTCENWMLTTKLSKVEQCMASELQVPSPTGGISGAEMESLKGIAAAFGPLGAAGAKMAEKMKAMKGYPMATTMTVDVMGFKSTSGSEVTEVRLGAIPAATWEIPAGYTKIENPQLKSLQASK